MKQEEQVQLKKVLHDVAFQDEFFQKTLVKLQRLKDAKNFDRVSRLWLDSKKALEAYARTADMKGLEMVVRERQAFIDQVILGTIKLFKDEPH